MEPYAAARQVTLDLQLAGLGAAGEHAPLPAGPTLQPDLDGKTLQQALINLIDNAIKHSPAGQTVTVSLQGSQPDALAPSASGAAAPSGPQWQQGTSGTEGKPAPGGGPSGLPVVLTISVVDRGPGIPVADRARIFEPFYRRGSELRRETQGVGIGLSIVRHIVAAHGGRVWVEGEAGQGSCFRLELPVRSHE
ncbi:MAG: ATP-binding protein [Verrucomicrobia bacterium]|nr:ATP-binding protein [Verrucomicrobiota bacterium]